MQRPDVLTPARLFIQCRALHLTCPIGRELMKMLKEEKNLDVAATLATMIRDVATEELTRCNYCRAFGHHRKDCPAHTFVRVRCHSCRDVDHLRGKMSEAVKNDARVVPSLDVELGRRKFRN